MVSGSSSKQKTTPLPPGSIDPSFALQANLLGQPVRLDPARGTLHLGTDFGAPGNVASPLVTRENLSGLSSLLDPITSVGVPNLQGLVGGIEEAGQTGFRTDLDPIIAQSLRLFETELVPQIQQGFANQGLGPFSSDLGLALSGAGADIATNLGALQVEADEAAADRRLSALGLTPGAFGDIASLETALDPSSNLLNLIQILSGLPVQPILQDVRKGRVKQGGVQLSGSAAPAG